MTNIEQLKKETDEIKKGLDELKNNVQLSEEEKKKQADTLKAKAEATKKKIENEIHSLESKTDDESKKKKEEAETLLTTFNETMALYTSILNTGSTNVPATTSENKDDEKGIWGKTKDWVGEQWDDVRDKDKWEKEGGKNLLRTTAFVATGVGAVSLAVKGVKKLWNRAFGKKEKEKESDSSDSKKDEKKNEKPRRKKFLTGAAVAAGTVIGGVEVYKHRNVISSRVKEKLGLALTFDEAKQKAENEVRNGIIDDDHFGAFKAHFEGGITFDEQTQEICSYGEKTKIEKKGKKLQGMDVEFASREELIHAANIVNFTKRKLAGRGASSTPFSKTNWGGDIAFNCSVNGKQEFLSANNSNEWSWILGTLGTAGGGLLGGYCAGVKGAAIGTVGGGLGGYALGAYIDNTSAAGKCCKTIARGRNFDLFLNYLNDQKNENGKSLWESAGEQRIDPDGTPINGLVDNGAENMSEREGVLAEIEKEYGEDQTGRRNLEIKRGGNEPGGNPEEYRIKSYNHEIKLTLKGGPTNKGDKIDYSKITNIHIEKYKDSDWGDGLDIDFPHTEKGLKEAIRTSNLTNMLREDWSKKGRHEFSFSCGRFVGLDGMSLYFDAGEFVGKGTRLLDRETLRKKYPTIFKDVTKEGVILGDHQKEYKKQAIDDESKGSQYIKFLHQMRDENGGAYRKK